ncbi:MAG: hypothetical protein ABI852_07430 [Gemmatimonadaceae bacterium]
MKFDADEVPIYIFNTDVVHGNCREKYMDAKSISDSIDREYARIGLNMFESPYPNLAGTLEGLREYLEVLQSLPVGATWRDVHPDMPAHWIPGDESTWTEPFRPYGDWDFQQTPAGSSIMVAFDGAHRESEFHALVERAKELGFQIYGSGIQWQHAPESRVTAGYIVSMLGTSESDQFRLADWAREQPGVMMARRDRNETDEYFQRDS